MTANKSGRWQYSLAALMIFVAVVAAVCAVAGLVGYALVFSIAPILWVFWATYRLVDTMIVTDNRNGYQKRDPDPIFKMPGG